jgi:hypothetical protein
MKISIPIDLIVVLWRIFVPIDLIVVLWKIFAPIDLIVVLWKISVPIDLIVVLRKISLDLIRSYEMFHRLDRVISLSAVIPLIFFFASSFVYSLFCRYE